MQVETYECQETAEETPEQSAEALALIDQLGLDGQRELVSPKEHGDSRNPYPEATGEQLFVFRTLCPEKYQLKTYKRSPIPLRVLQVAAHASSLVVFESIEIWDHTSQEVQDPVLVGIIGSSYSPTHVHLLARWGEALDAWPALVAKACDVFKANLVAKLHDIQQQVTARLTAAENTAASVYLRNHGMPSYYD